MSLYNIESLYVSREAFRASVFFFFFIGSLGLKSVGFGWISPRPLGMDDHLHPPSFLVLYFEAARKPTFTARHFFEDIASFIVFGFPSASLVL